MRVLHILVILFGGLIFIVSAFIDGVWFDEAFTVAAIENGMIDMICRLTFDVHPHLYYIVIKIWSYIFGDGIIALRLFSAIFAVAVTLLGYTHIRKDFGDRVGFWFSFLTVFSFSTLKYALQIRMYTLGIFLLALTGIYLWRYINSNSKKDRVLYLIFSILSAYTHYFAFFLVAVINAFTLIRAIKKEETKNWFKDAYTQVLGYLPGFIVFAFQISLNGANWIRVIFPDVLFDTVLHPFIGMQLRFYTERGSFWFYIVGIFAVLLFSLIYWTLYSGYKKKKEGYKAPFLAVSVCLAVFAFTLAVSVFRPIYHQRYSVLFTPFWAFAFAFLFSKINFKWVKSIIALLLVICFLIFAIPFWKQNYEVKDKTYSELIDLDEADIIVTNDFHSFVYMIKFKNKDTVFYNPWGWTIEDTYTLFGDSLSFTQELSDYKNYNGKIWACGRETLEFFDSLENAKVIKEKQYFPNYYDENDNFKKYELTFRLYEIKAD
ncbi:MAG: glycosyltransferase family 39 protein [Clostridia bacterium]|nr:glycosyltransferase family 39 protein [Clostridia bacterium]